PSENFDDPSVREPGRAATFLSSHERAKPLAHDRGEFAQRPRTGLGRDPGGARELAAASGRVAAGRGPRRRRRDGGRGPRGGGAAAQRPPWHSRARVAVWLYRLAVRHVLIYRRKSGRRRSLVDRYAARRGVSAIDATPSPLGWLVRDERQRLVHEALGHLAPR